MLCICRQKLVKCNTTFDAVLLRHNSVSAFTFFLTGKISTSSMLFSTWWAHRLPFFLLRWKSILGNGGKVGAQATTQKDYWNLVVGGLINIYVCACVRACKPRGNVVVAKRAALSRICVIRGIQAPGDLINLHSMLPADPPDTSLQAPPTVCPCACV